MDIILGATGHVGSNVAKNLMALDERILVVTHSPDKIVEWTSQNSEVACVDVHDTNALNKVFQRGEKLFFLNPPADPGLEDAIKEEKMTVYSILDAIKNSNIKKVVAESTYGAQAGDSIGDLGVLHEMEVGLKELGVETSIIRAAYYMSNWDMCLESAKNNGEIISLYPEDFKLPMVAPEDLGKVASDLLMEENRGNVIVYVEGPEKYSPGDVARSFSKYLGKDVRVKVIEETDWISFLMNVGFSRNAAESMAAMTKITLEENYDLPVNPIRGKITLDQYVRALIGQ